MDGCRSSRFLPLLFVLLVAALVYPLGFWYFHCTSFNGGDEAGYLTALDFAYGKIRSEGFSALPSLSCGMPGSHHMLWPELGLLPMFLFSGNVIVSYRVTLFFFYLLVLLYTFLNVNLICRDKALAIFATCIIGSAPWLVRHAQIFFNEIAWIAAVSAAIYHAQSSDGWRKKLHALAGGIAIALAICVRPMETFVTCFPLACLVVLRSYRRGILDQAAYAAGVAATALILLAARLHDRHTSLNRISHYLAIAGGLCALAMIDWALVRKLRGFKLWVLGAVLPALFFWIPRIQGFYVHARSCTFGSTIKTNPGAIPNANLLDFLKDFLLVFGHENLVFLALLMLALLAARAHSTARKVSA